MWQKVVHDFVASEIKTRREEINEEELIPWDVIHKMGPMGLLSKSVSVDHEGSDLDPLSAALAIKELGWGDGGLVLTVEAHDELGCAAVAMFGTEEQKGNYSPP